ncbi:hypothetical protein PAXRUDRAFT_161207 [Paxillus rubicundulus Ve08.2h10]|uniref:Uncharacterized protein n=1 Tax=Paxillus rubicundulus Ve08.2h10 TaxID=930991 RepID=A0A0D0C9D6_9AGAM|nr:hypothetical protein PAXRUDRAFT_161207 [Paxillus rubicundulus Ve08.2h10]
MEDIQPFQLVGDFEFAKIALEAMLNKGQIDWLLGLISHITNGNTKATLRNGANLSKAYDNVAITFTPVSVSFVEV